LRRGGISALWKELELVDVLGWNVQLEAWAVVNRVWHTVDFFLLALIPAVRVPTGFDLKVPFSLGFGLELFELVAIQACDGHSGLALRLFPLRPQLG
jgi:hypothetical protein